MKSIFQTIENKYRVIIKKIYKQCDRTMQNESIPLGMCLPLKEKLDTLNFINGMFCLHSHPHSENHWAVDNSLYLTLRKVFGNIVSRHLSVHFTKREIKTGKG